MNNSLFIFSFLSVPPSTSTTVTPHQQFRTVHDVPSPVPNIYLNYTRPPFTMGNNPSTNTKSPNSASSSPSIHESAKPSSSRREHPRNLIQNQRTAAAAEASLAQARGTTATHRPRNSQSIPTAHLSHPSPSPNSNSASPRSTPSQMGAQQSREEPKADVRYQPSKPVDVPVSAINTTESASLRSHSHSIEPSGPPATQDMSYHLTRPS